MRSIGYTGWWCVGASCAVWTMSRPAAAVRTRFRSGVAVAAVGLLASAMAVLGAADAFAVPGDKPVAAKRGKATAAARQKPVAAKLGKATRAARHKSVAARFPRTTRVVRHKAVATLAGKAAKAQRHAYAAKPKRSVAARLSEKRRAARAATMPVPRPRPGLNAPVAALSSDLAAAKQAIALVRQGRPQRSDHAGAIDRRSGGAEAGRMGAAAPFGEPGRIHALCRLHPRQSRLAGHSPAAPARRGEAVAGAARRRDRAPLRRRGTDERGRPARARARADGGGRPRRRRARSAHGVAVGAAVGRLGGRGARRVRRRADPLRPSGAHGPAHRRQGLRRRDARCQTSRRCRRGDRQGLHRRQGELRQGRGAARRGSRRGTRGFGLRAVPPPLAHATNDGECRGGGQAGARGGARGHAASGHRRMVARASRAGPQAYRSRRCRTPPIRSCARRRLRPIPITAPTSTSWPAGSRCAFSPTRPPRSSISPTSTTARPIRSCGRVPPTGAAAPPRRPAGSRRCGRTTRPLPAILPPITASWRAPGSASTRSLCARRRRS